MSAYQRRKGAAGEREVCRILADELGTVVERHLGQARDGGEDIALPPFRLEVKRRASIAMLRWLEQCQCNARDDEVPVVVMREDRGEWVVLMRFADWIPLAREEIVG